MIIRKPYAFLIKNFKKIHIFLFILCAYIYYQNLRINAFVNEFLEFLTYDEVSESITRYINIWLYLAIIFVVVASANVLILLNHKKKPWKVYLIPIAEYTLMFASLILTSNFFATYSGSLDTTEIRAIRDILFILTFPQYFFFIVLAIRIFGIDLNKFDFKSDQEYLDLNEDDREELEINIKFEKGVIKRKWNYFKRNTVYFFKEHQRLVMGVLTIALVFVIYKSYLYIFVTNKSYREGQNINTSGYTIQINNSYYTNKDYKGNVISPKSSFVVLNITIKNNVQKREINFNRFHLMNGKSNYSPSLQTYANQFKDFGKSYVTRTIEPNEEFNLIMVYKVAPEEAKNKFVLYYQEFTSEHTNHLRKIKIKLNDVSEIKKNDPIALGDVGQVIINGEENDISFDDYEISKTATYVKKNCNSQICYSGEEEYTAKDGYSILKMSFSANEYDGAGMMNLLSENARLVYSDENNELKYLSIVNGLDTLNYYGKYIYIRVPEALEKSETLKLEFTYRNNKYTFNIKEPVKESTE